MTTNLGIWGVHRTPTEQGQGTYSAPRGKAEISLTLLALSLWYGGQNQSTACASCGLRDTSLPRSQQCKLL